MSWIENINRDFTIIMSVDFDVVTGVSAKGKVKVAHRHDSATFTPNWLNATRSVEYNINEFNFKNVAGTLVRRQMPMGTKYNLEIYFQGEDNLIESARFKRAADNVKTWNIAHPMYGTIIVQPISLAFDDSSYNVTKVQAQVMETIGIGEVITNISPIDTIQVKKLSVDDTFANSYLAQVPIPDALDISSMKANIGIAYRLQAAFSTTTDALATVTNTYNAAFAIISGGASDVLNAIKATQAVLSLPEFALQNVFNRVAFLVRTGQAIYTNLTTLHTPHLKKLFENNMAALLSTMCATSVTNITPADYPNRIKVLQVADMITQFYDNYVRDLDTLQSANGGVADTYIPDWASLNDLSQLVRFTIANLFDIAVDAKQQRTITTATDDNLITLAFQLYGLLPDDSTITQLQEDNNISFNELLQIKKGREIIYYI